MLARSMVLAAMTIALTKPLAAQTMPLVPLPSAPTALVAAARLAPSERPVAIRWPVAMAQRAPSKRVVVGGVLGAVVGVAACTAISNLIEEEGGFHTCTAKGNVLFGLGGAVVGALVAHATRE